MFRRMFRQRNVKKASRELPPIPKPDDWSAGEEGPDKTYHIYEEIPDKAHDDFQEKLQDLKIADDRTIPPPAPCAISVSPTTNLHHSAFTTLSSWRDAPCSPIPISEDEARVQRLRRVCQIQYKDYLIDPEKARLSDQAMLRHDQHSERSGLKKMSTSLDNSRLGSDSRDLGFHERNMDFLMDQDKSNGAADMQTDKSDLVRSCTDAIRRNSEDAPQLTRHLAFTLAGPSPSGCRAKLPPGPVPNGPKKLVQFKEHVGKRRNPATVGATAAPSFGTRSLQSPRHRKKVDDESDVFWGPRDPGARMVRTIDKKAYMLPREPSERTKQTLQPDGLDREDTDSSENCYEYDVSGLSGSSDCSSTGYCNYDSYLKNVEKNFQHCQHVLNIVRHRSDSDSKKSQSEENLDCVSLTTVSSLSHSSSMSTLASYGDASDEGESYSDTDYEVINDACNRIQQENKLSVSCTAFDRSRQMSSGRGRKPPSVRARSLVTRSERRAELPLPKEEFKIPDMRSRHSSSRSHSKKSARSSGGSGSGGGSGGSSGGGGGPVGAPVTIAVAAAAYNNRAGNNKLLNELIRLNFEQQWKHL